MLKLKFNCHELLTEHVTLIINENVMQVKLLYYLIF